jgi:hypothetical protein
VIRPGNYADRSIFLDRGTLWRPKVGASDGVIEEVPPPWFDRLLLRWLPTLALRRAQARRRCGGWSSSSRSRRGPAW